MPEFTPLENLTLAIPGAGRRALLAALPDGMRGPKQLRLCILDATRMDAPAQLALMDELAATPELDILFALNKLDRLSTPQNAVQNAVALLREHGFSQPRLWPVCAAAARLFGLSAEDTELRPKEINAQAEYYQRFAPGKNSLSALSVTEETVSLLDGCQVSPEQLHLAKINTGVPALEAALRAAGVSDAARTAPVEDGSAEASAHAPQEDLVENAIDQLLDRLDEGEVPSAAKLASLLALAEKADCAALLEMAKNVQNDEADPVFRERALSAIHTAYQARETEELEALTADVDTMDLEALRATVERINTGAYTVQARTPYAQRVNQRIDALMQEQLADICAGVETADAPTLMQIRQKLDRVDCAEILKTVGYQRIETRQDQLDLENLERITAGAENMTEKELRSLAVTLEANNWNPKFVTRFRQKVALCRQTVVFQELEQELAELNDLERREVLALRERIRGKELAPRFTAGPLAQIDERLYRMDMLRLMALNNDFDLLDFDGLDTLRTQVGKGEYTDRARAEYLGRLREREEALVVENTDARAQLVRQLIGQTKLRMADFVFAAQTEAYRTRLNAYWGGSGMEQPRDIPVFFFDNGSDYAFTGERFYYKVGKELAFLPIADIDRFQTMKQHMSLVLQVVRKDNSYLLTNAKISRSGGERTLEFLNTCLNRWNAPELVGARSTNPIRTHRFETADFTAPVEIRLPDAALALEIFRRRYEEGRLREGNLFRAGEEGWEQRTAKLLEFFGLPETTPLIWFDTSGLLGSVREGVAVGPKAIYWKDSKQPMQSVPLAEIYGMESSGRQMSITDLQGQSYRLELPAAMFPLVEDYVRAIQLGNYLRSREERA
ncbi:MAG: hypothetical protein IIY94_04215 [Oscillospiraceae bacterium]|nr:hypothetical protein [Oscillospiraceae bacterium]